jgi:serine/threonine protein phosphatase 1
VFGFRKAKAPPRVPRPAPAIPPDRLIYAVGDIHGRADLLGQLLALINEDAEKRSFAGRLGLIFLGDYIDRGGASNQVIETLIALKANERYEVMALRGNHDQFLLDFLAQPTLGRSWINFGGAATLASYGVSAPRVQSDESGWIAVGQQLADAIPASHLEFLQATHYCATFGDYVFAHAGVRPGVSLQDQKWTDFLSIRDAFLNSRDAVPGQVVVFGHTPFDRPLVEDDKIGIDTGACATGVLTALSLWNDTRRFIQTGEAGVSDVPPPIVKSADRPRRL